MVFSLDVEMSNERFISVPVGGGVTLWWCFPHPSVPAWLSQCFMVTSLPTPLSLNGTIIWFPKNRTWLQTLLKHSVQYTTQAVFICQGSSMYRVLHIPGSVWTLKTTSSSCSPTGFRQKSRTGWRPPSHRGSDGPYDVQMRSPSSAASCMQCRPGYLWRGVERFLVLLE